MQINLPAVLARDSTNRVLIRGNGATVLSLSDPQCSDSRIQVSLQPLGMERHV